MQRDVVALSFKLNAETLISRDATAFARVLCQLCDGCQESTKRACLKSFERFLLMAHFDDTAMFMYGQMISSYSSDNVDTDEIFMMALKFFLMQSILDQVCKKKIFTTRAHSGRYPESSFHPFWNGPQGNETFIKRYSFSRDCF